MLRLLVRVVQWLPRKWRSRGFGVQSPSDYYFLRHVLRQPLPYYGYGPSTPFQRLCLRLANYTQAEAAFVSAECQEARAYVSRGCRKTVIATTADGCGLCITGSYLSLDRLPQRAVIVVAGIDNEAKQAWCQMTKDARATIVFEALHTGIIIADSARYRQYYKIML